MSDGEEEVVANGEAEAKPVAAAAPDEPMDVNTAVQNVLKKALAYDGLARGLHETARALDRGEGQLCVLAEDCDQPDYKKLVEALCSEHNVSLLSVPEAKQLGQWAGVSRTAFMSYKDGCICFTTEEQAFLERQAEPWPQGSVGVADGMLCKIDAEGEARKVVGCSSVVVTNWGEETPGRSVLQEYLKNK